MAKEGKKSDDSRPLRGESLKAGRCKSFQNRCEWKFDGISVGERTALEKSKKQCNKHKRGLDPAGAKNHLAVRYRQAEKGEKYKRGDLQSR